MVRVASAVLPCAAIATAGLWALWPEATPVRPADRIERVPSELFERPPLGQEVTFHTSVDAELRRARLERFVFGRVGLPRRLPAVERGVEDVEFADGLSNVDRIDRLTVKLAFGFTSVAYHVLPKRANGRLLVYHNGHDEGFLAGKDTVAYFLERGYAVLVFAMPFAGHNTNPATAETRCGRVELAPAGHFTSHDSLACFPRPLRLFLEPVAVGLNHTETLDYELTAMVGLSGGGWTTMVYAALDPRVRRSYPVAGSLPFYLTARWCPGDSPETVPRCFGDFEQRLPAFYRIANHLELYALGSWGRGRKQTAIMNVHDACCFSGRDYLEWRPRVQAAVRRLGSGAYDAVGDTTHRSHILSPFARRVIASDLEDG
jgi:pimeloyl-ACP methyl ester carboxylesterase